MRQITIYTTPICQRCNIVKRWLQSRGIPFATVDLTESPDDHARMKALGYREAPITVVSYGNPETDIHWGGVDVAKLTEYCTAVAA